MLSGLMYSVETDILGTGSNSSSICCRRPSLKMGQHRRGIGDSTSRQFLLQHTEDISGLGSPRSRTSALGERARMLIADFVNRKSIRLVRVPRQCRPLETLVLKRSRPSSTHLSKGTRCMCTGNSVPLFITRCPGSGSSSRHERTS